MVRDATGVGEQEAAKALTTAGGSAKVAIVMLLAGMTSENAQRCIELAHGSVRHALVVAATEKEARVSQNSADE